MEGPNGTEPQKGQDGHFYIRCVPAVGDTAETSGEGSAFEAQLCEATSPSVPRRP